MATTRRAPISEKEPTKYFPVLNESLLRDALCCTRPHHASQSRARLALGSIGLNAGERPIRNRALRSASI